MTIICQSYDNTYKKLNFKLIAKSFFSFKLIPFAKTMNSFRQIKKINGTRNNGNFIENPFWTNGQTISKIDKMTVKRI